MELLPPITLMAMCLMGVFGPVPATLMLISGVSVFMTKTWREMAMVFLTCIGFLVGIIGFPDARWWVNGVACAAVASIESWRIIRQRNLEKPKDPPPPPAYVTLYAQT